jgi:hypothetical protein
MENGEIYNFESPTQLPPSRKHQNDDELTVSQSNMSVSVDKQTKSMDCLT